MIYVVGNADFEATLTGAPTGLVGTLGVQIVDGQGGVVFARTTTGIVEHPAGSGIYTATLTAPDPLGSYVLVWDDGAGTFAGEELFVTTNAPFPPALPADWHPTVEMVATYLRARTKDSMMNEIGTFNENTRPTYGQVEAAIDTAIVGLFGCVGDWLPETIYPKAQRVIALGAALIIELSFWPEQIEDEQSPYQHLKEMYDEEQIELCQISAGYRPSDIPGPGEVATGVSPMFYFGDGDWAMYARGVWTYDPANQEWIYRIPPEGPVTGVYPT